MQLLVGRAWVSLVFWAAQAASLAFWVLDAAQEVLDAAREVLDAAREVVVDEVLDAAQEVLGVARGLGQKAPLHWLLGHTARRRQGLQAGLQARRRQGLQALQGPQVRQQAVGVFSGGR